MGWLKRLRNLSGFSLLELVVTVGIMAVVIAILIPYLAPQSRYFDRDVREFVDNLQVAREFALSRSLHYQLQVTSASTYVIAQGSLVSGSWTFPTIVRSVTLASGVRFGSGSVGQAAEFDTRGQLVGASLTFSVIKTVDGTTKTIQVYPTGMVEKQ